MNFISSTRCLSWLLVAWAMVLSPLAHSTIANELPEMRPALVGSGRGSIINLINTQSLMKRGQGHAALFFYIVVYPDGHTGSGQIWGETKESELLRDELKNKLREANF